jgi:ABC-type multidrug transport system ATPase subunit
VAVEVRGLTKTFGKFSAVRGNFFRVEKGKLFALLGPNGAGKTTTINLLTGLLPISSGDATVCGHSLVAGELPAIRRLMGVCPQFDILWGELTAEEHLRLFAALKGLPRELWATTTSELLERTKLTAAARRRSSGYSGGMKRRLSVAIALIGDPEVVYLDEPTTGMDPITRRYVWDVILEAKAGRAIVLTTHSMEEADVLADNITIIAKGRLRCLGSSLRLKNKFGAGYRISASVAQPAAPAAGQPEQLALSAEPPAADNSKLLAFFKEQLGVVPAEAGRVYSTFTIPRAMEERLPAFLQALLKSRGALGLTDVQVSQTTLEQVFLLIAREAEKQAAAADGRMVQLSIPMGEGQAQALTIPWGAEQAVMSATGEAVNITWVQDDEGRLMYSHHTWRGERVTQHGLNDDMAQRKCCFCC